MEGNEYLRIALENLQRAESMPLKTAQDVAEVKKQIKAVKHMLLASIKVLATNEQITQIMDMLSEGVKETLCSNP